MSRDLKIDSAKRSVQALKDSMKVYNKYNDTVDTAGTAELTEQNGQEEIFKAVRSGVIHNFEIAYEQCWKFMQRWLELNISPNIAKGVFRKEFYRIAVENALIDDALAWFSFHETRNSTAHTYDEEIAGEVLKKIIEFMPYAEKFVETVEKMEGQT